jgi:hypothetical protein
VAASSSLRDARNKAIAIAPIEIATMRSHERRSIGERLGLLVTCYLFLLLISGSARSRSAIASARIPRRRSCRFRHGLGS